MLINIFKANIMLQPLDKYKRISIFGNVGFTKLCRSMTSEAQGGRSDAIPPPRTVTVTNT